MQEHFIEKTARYCDENGILRRGDRVVAALSGGPDSICLLRVLCALKAERKLEITAVHVHHGLRSSADDDESFVRDICAEWNVPLRVYHYDVTREAAMRGMSLEEAGRAVRYEALEDVRSKTASRVIAVGHHMDDQAETILWNLIRGSGVRGLSGMAPERDNIVRPLLCVRRQEIEAFLSREGIPFCTDETNSENDYTRNKIRNVLIPKLEAEYNAQVRTHIVQAGDAVRKMADYFEKAGREAFLRCVTVSREQVAAGEEIQLTVLENAYGKEDDAIQEYILHLAIEKAAGSRKDIGHRHIEAVKELFGLQTGKRIDLPYGLLAERIYSGVRIRKSEGANLNRNQGDEGPITEDPVCFPISCRNGDAKAPGGCPLQTSVITLAAPGEWQKYTKENAYTKCFDYDIIKHDLCVRNRMPGDYLVIDETGKTQKLKDFFINEKVPKEKRGQILLLTEGSRILWIQGYRMGANYKVTDRTGRVLQVTVKDPPDRGKEEDESGKL